MAKEFSRRSFIKGAAAAAGSALFGLAAAGCGSQVTSSAAQAEDAVRDLYILYTNDVHCGIDDNIGYAGLMDAKAALKALGKDVLLADVGDFIQGGLTGTVSKGSYIIDLMNLAGYDIVTIGNHEFDWGMDNLFDRVSEMNFPVVCCNLTDADGRTVFDPYRIMEAAGRKIAFIGAVTPMTITSSTPKFFQDQAGNFIYDFCTDSSCDALAAAVQTAIDSAKAEGADLCVMLGHIGVDPEGKSTMYGQMQSTTLIEKTRGLSLFLDGHSHTVMPSETVNDADGNPVVLTQTGTKLAYIGLAVIGADGTITTRLLDDAGMKALIADIKADMDEDLKKVVATAEYPLYINDPKDPTKRIVRFGETNLGDFCADAFRITANAEIGLINGGAIRSDLPAGQLTIGDVMNTFPFNNQVCNRKVTGAQLLDALELSVSQYPAEFGGFLQVSGISFTVDSSIPTPVKLDSNTMFAGVDGARRVKDVLVGGEPLEEEREYAVASNTYILANNGNGYTMFDGDEFILEAGPIDNEALITYMQDTLGGVIGEEYESPAGEGRIIIE